MIHGAVSGVNKPAVTTCDILFHFFPLKKDKLRKIVVCALRTMIEMIVRMCHNDVNTKYKCVVVYLLRPKDSH